MATYRLTLQPLTAFGTPLVGDTLFGQLCWALRHRYGNARLIELLKDYVKQPFAVLSDAFPHGYLPLPSIPPSFWKKVDNEQPDRKALKKKRWIAVEKCREPLETWQKLAVELAMLDGKLTEKTDTASAPWQTSAMQPHNTLDRQTNTTGTGQFAPYLAAQTWFHPKMTFDLYVVLDESRLRLAEFITALDDVGQTGYGRDASIGLGKFQRCGEPEVQPANADSHAWLTLAPCAPQGLGLDAAHSFYQVQTCFGRHGDMAVRAGNPFKKPLLMARTAALLYTASPQSRQFIGQGISGTSLADPNTVHQGYAPVLPLSWSPPK